jgi:hypothetical protein
MSLIKNPDRFVDDLLSHLDIPESQKELVKKLRENKQVAEKTTFTIVDYNFKRSTTTDFKGIPVTFTPRADGKAVLAFFPAGESVVLRDMVLQELERVYGNVSAPLSYSVPDGKVVVAFDLGAQLGVTGAGSTSGTGWDLALSAEASGSARVRYFKELDSALGARDLAGQAAGSLRSLFHLTTHTVLAPGEIVVTEFDGSLKLGASFDYGWKVSGTKKVSAGFDDVELQADYSVSTKLGVDANLRFEQGVSTVVRPAATEVWVNVSLMKRRENEAGVAVNLSVDAKLASKALVDGKTREVGAFVDSLLERTPLPDLMAELKKWDTPAELQAAGDAIITRLVDQVSGEIESVVTVPVENLEALLEPIREKARALLDEYQQLDTKVAGFLEKAIEETSALSTLNQGVSLIADATSAESLIIALSGDQGEDVRKVLDVLTRYLEVDLSQISWLEDSFGKLQKIAKDYQNLQHDVLERYETKYRWLKSQLDIEDAVALIEKAIEHSDLSALLDAKILWLEQYLSAELDKPVNQLIENLEPALEKLKALTDGYTKLVKKTKGALTSALNQEIGIQASLAWQKISTHEALVSVDLNLGEQAGIDALESVLRGRLDEVMQARLTNVNAIRLRKSYFLDRLRQSVNLRAVINGRESLRIRSLLLSTKTYLEPTDTGEIWIQESKVEDRLHRANRRGILNINTMFEVSLREVFEIRDEALLHDRTELGGYGLSYSYNEQFKQEIAADTLRQHLDHTVDDIAFEVVPASEYSDLISRIVKIGAFGKLSNTSLHIQVALERDALVELFSQDDSDHLADQIKVAWDRAVFSTFADKPRVLRFYQENKEGIDDISEVKRAKWQLKVNEQFICQNTVNCRGTFADILRAIHKKVFLKYWALDLEIGMEGAADREKLQNELRKRLKKLGKKMQWINGIEFAGHPRDFTMAVFANLADKSDRSGSISVDYTHPVSRENMVLRAES